MDIVSARWALRLHPVISTTTTQPAVSTCIVGVSPVAAGEGGKCLRSPVCRPCRRYRAKALWARQWHQPGGSTCDGVVALMLQENWALSPDEVQIVFLRNCHRSQCLCVGPGSPPHPSGESHRKDGLALRLVQDDRDSRRAGMHLEGRSRIPWHSAPRRVQ